jgi:hypothetical protein
MGYDLQDALGIEAMKKTGNTFWLQGRESTRGLRSPHGIHRGGDRVSEGLKTILELTLDGPSIP